DLAGLPVEGPCPECGKSIESSLRGDLLEYAEPAYVATLHRGVRLLLVSLALGVLTTMIALIAGLTIGGTGGPARSPFLPYFHFFNLGLGTVLSGLSILGWYLFSAPVPGVHLRDKGDRPRRVVRAAV